MTKKIRGTQSITKAALLLRTLSTFSSSGASLGQISWLANIPKSSTHRILAALVLEQLVERVPASSNYRLGRDIVNLGLTLSNSTDMRTVSQPILKALAVRLGVASYLGIRSGYDIVCISRCEPPGENHQLVMQVNDRWPLGVGSLGLSVLAQLNEVEMTRVIEFNQRRIKSIDALTFRNIHRSVYKTRLRGFAKRSMLAAERLTGIAVSVLNRNNSPIASICAVLPSDHLNAKFLVTVVSELRESAAQLGQAYENTSLHAYVKESWQHAIRNSYSSGATGLIKRAPRV